MIQTIIKKISPFIIVVVVTLLASWSLFVPGFPPTHDGEYHIIRFHQFYQTITGGWLYPRWAADLNNGYGVPLFNYVYPLPNYVASGLHMFGLQFIDAFKLSMVLATFVGGWGMFILSKKLWGVLGGIVSSILYIFAPYRFVDIYVRGSIGEVWALAFAPLLIWSYMKLVTDKKSIYSVVGGIFLALIIFSHNILGLMFFIFLVTLMLLTIATNKNKRYVLLQSAVTILIGLSLSAIFWLPALAETGYVRGLQIYEIDKNFPELYQLLVPSWGTGFSGDDLGNQMSFQIGIILMLVVMVACVHLARRFKSSPRLMVAFFLGWFFFSLFIMLPISSTLWGLPLLNYFQFPWRFLSITIFTASFLGGYAVYMFNLRLKVIFAVLIGIFAIILTYGYTKPAYYHQRNDDHYTSRENFIRGTNSPGNLFNTVWFDKSLALNKNDIESNEQVKIELLQNSSQRRVYKVVARDKSVVTANIAYFPGWKAYADQTPLAVQPSKQGLIQLEIPKGEYMLEIVFGDTMIRSIAKWWTILAIGGTVFLLIRMERKSRRNRVNRGRVYSK